MSYTITGIGLEHVNSVASDLEAAARKASRMEDQGVKGVRVFAASGVEVSRSEWEAAWRNWAQRSR